MSVNKYFIAIVLTGDLLEKTEALKKELFDAYGLKGALRSPAHITLHRPFEWRADKEEQLLTRLSSFRFGKQTEIRLEDFAAFAPRVIYVNVPENDVLKEMHAELKKFAVRELKLFNEAEDMRGFHPHVTIAFRDLKKNRFAEVWREFAERRFSGTFRMEGFSLLRLGDKWEEIAFFKTGA